jgi:hypothetical protein
MFRWCFARRKFVATLTIFEYASNDRAATFSYGDAPSQRRWLAHDRLIAKLDGDQALTVVPALDMCLPVPLSGYPEKQPLNFQLCVFGVGLHRNSENSDASCWHYRSTAFIRISHGCAELRTTLTSTYLFRSWRIRRWRWRRRTACCRLELCRPAPCAACFSSIRTASSRPSVGIRFRRGAPSKRRFAFFRLCA